MTMTIGLPSGLLWMASAGTTSALATVRPWMDDVDGVPGLSSAFGILNAQPDFDGGAAGIERGTDERDLGGYGSGRPGTVTVAGAPSSSNCACICGYAASRAVRRCPSR